MLLYLLRNRLGCFGPGFPAFRQIRIEKSEHVSVFDDARAFPFLQFSNQLHALRIENGFAGARNERAVEVGAKKLNMHCRSYD